MFPMCLPILGSRRHSSSPISLVCSMEITRIHTFEVIWKTVQDPWFGSGKRLLNRVSKSVCDLQCHSGTLPKDREGMSVIEFSTPGMWQGVIGHACLSLIRNANARTSCAATTECLDASLFTQLTVGSLSLNTATLFSLMSPHTVSITNHTSNRPAISKSEFVMCPCGFSKVTRSSLIAAGHSKRNTVGGHACDSPNTTPPTPWLDASVTPM